MFQKIFYLIAIFNQTGYIDNNTKVFCDNSSHICCQNLDIYQSNMSCTQNINKGQVSCHDVNISSLSSPNISKKLKVYRSTGSGDMYNSYLKNTTKLGLPLNSHDLMTFQVLNGSDSNMRYKFRNELCFKSCY